jgi:putative membrane protein
MEIGFLRGPGMFEAMKPFVLRWLVTTLAVAVAVPLVGIQWDSISSLLAASLLLGIVNAFVRPVLLLLSLPLILLTLGFFILIINALMLKMVGGIVPGFHVYSFSSAFFGSIIISIVSWLLSAFFRASDGRVYAITHHTQMKQAQGRVIDSDS